MREYFYKFLRETGISFKGMPLPATVAEIAVNFNRWANHRPTNEDPIRRGPNRQGTSKHQVQKYLEKLLK